MNTSCYINITQCLITNESQSIGKFCKKTVNKGHNRFVDVLHSVAYITVCTYMYVLIDRDMQMNFNYEIHIIFEWPPNNPTHTLTVTVVAVSCHPQ